MLAAERYAAQLTEFYKDYWIKQYKPLEIQHKNCDDPRPGWGYEPDHYDVSMACGEHALLPKVREASPETLVVSDGFSCRSQIEQGDTGRRGVHVAQVLELARERGGIPAYPERELYEMPEQAPKKGRRALQLGALAAAAGAAVLAARTLR